MTAKSLIREVKKRGGTAELISKMRPGFGGKMYESFTVVGQLNDHDIHMIGDHSSFFTVREISKRGYFDPGADYNSGGYTFCNRIKDLDWAIS